MPLDMQIETFDDAIEYVMDLIGSEFEKSLGLANSILENPSDYTGPQAAITAIKLSTHRYKIGIAAQYWKIKSAQTKTLPDRLVKDCLMSAFTGLEEVINTLKIVARHEHELVGSRK